MGRLFPGSLTVLLEESSSTDLIEESSSTDLIEERSSIGSASSMIMSLSVNDAVESIIWILEPFSPPFCGMPRDIGSLPVKEFLSRISGQESDTILLLDGSRPRCAPRRDASEKLLHVFAFCPSDVKSRSSSSRW